MNVNCPKCTTGIPAEKINISTSMAVCPSCHHLFRLEEGWEEEARRDTSHKEVLRAPEGVESRTEFNKLVIRVDNKKLTKGWWEFWFGAFFLAFSSLFMLLMWSDGMGEGIPWFVFILISVFTAVGAFVFWGGLCKVINVTTIRVGSFDLRVSHSPINFGKYKERKYPVSEIEQFFVRRYSNKSQNKRPIYEYAVDFTTNNQGRTAWLLKDLSEPEAAWFIEREIETYLNIRDKTVIGEFDPSYQPQFKLSDVVHSFRQVIEQARQNR